ncbi:hypothetical protein Asp14428_77610 [Actinoplanes sp. NBRC 14428]|uniref:Uncharacterized protein DUF1801 n=1 Tax=Pseudosporangium ferrugineum TaxID=439699 RepID=A0A2T0RWV2_9ACTN|nr:DUF1801 domain-containing protein [Pseudosporangium ferrugineum]PRY25669.1 uncharacterized protein DUF1801 [Pseudosporangium ferrugineum]BCJ56286.1 hypothetical protein Asp14428_77610 [Actinoplanes sp. NBRC 14428]
MAAVKTVRTGASVGDFLAAVPDPVRRADARTLCALMAEATGVPPEMWGDSIVGFGRYHYRYASGQEGDWPPVGLSPRRTALTVYLSAGYDEDLLTRLGPHRTGRSCLHLRRLADIDRDVLRTLIGDGFHKLHGKTLTAD